jgi:hypothetical protein
MLGVAYEMLIPDLKKVLLSELRGLHPGANPSVEPKGRSPNKIEDNNVKPNSNNQKQVIEIRTVYIVITLKRITDMKPVPPLLLAICCILAFCGVCGCTSAPPQPSGGGAGIQDVTHPVLETKTDLKTALEELDILAGEGVENITGMEVFTVTGTAVTRNAEAGTWVLGVRQDGTAALLVYSRGSWSRFAWNGTLPDEAVAFDEILMPADLYSLHTAKIDVLGEETDLLLEHGVYTIRSHSDRPDAVAFDARTGEVI